jgi:hypothetical protein
MENTLIGTDFATNSLKRSTNQVWQAPISKFSYLKEFVEPKVRKSIDGLPTYDSQLKAIIGQKVFSKNDMAKRVK